MATKMNWQRLRQEASEWFDERTGDCDVDEVCGDVLRFIPAEPNKAADAEWLEKERGWVKDQQFIHRLRHPLLRLQFSNFEGGTLYVFDDFQNVEFPNPTRMTVALFEAAAKEAMKHGE